MWTSVPQMPVLPTRDQHVVDADLGLGHVEQREARRGLVLDQSSASPQLYGEPIVGPGKRGAGPGRLAGDACSPTDGPPAFRCRRPGGLRDRRGRLGRERGAASRRLAGAAMRGRPQNGVTTIPIKVIKRGEAVIPIVNMCFAGKGPYPMVLDTGAEFTVITTKFAKELGLKPLGSPIGAEGAGCKTKTRAYELESASVGGVELEGSSILTVDAPEEGDGATARLARRRRPQPLRLGQDRLQEGNVDPGGRRRGPAIQEGPGPGADSGRAPREEAEADRPDEGRRGAARACGRRSRWGSVRPSPGPG